MKLNENCRYILCPITQQHGLSKYDFYSSPGMFSPIEIDDVVVLWSEGHRDDTKLPILQEGMQYNAMLIFEGRETCWQEMPHSTKVARLNWTKRNIKI